MAFIMKVAAIIFLMCIVIIFAENLEDVESNLEDRNGEFGRHFVKRSLYQDGDNNFQPAYENAFDRPHRIRMLPGFLH